MELVIKQQTAEQLRQACIIGKIGTFTLNVETGEAQWDQSFYKVLKLDEGVNESLQTYLEMVHPKYRDEIIESMEKLKSGLSDSYDNEYLLKAGDEWLWIKAKAKKSEKDQLLYGVIIDITESKNNEIQLRQLLANMESFRKDIREFSSDLSAL